MSSDHPDREHSQAPRSPWSLSWLRDLPHWTLSAVLHLFVVLILVAVVVYEEQPRKKEMDTTVRPKISPPPYSPTAKRDLQRAVKVLNKDFKSIDRSPVEVTPDIPKGSPLDVDTRPLPVIGPGGSNTSSAYGERIGKLALGREGGGEATEDAVRAALEWLRRHQNPDGSWSSHDFTTQCRKICRNENPGRYGDGKGFEDHDVGVTGLAILAFTGYGHTHRYGVYKEYVEVLKKAMRFLKKVQVRSNDPETRRAAGAPRPLGVSTSPRARPAATSPARPRGSTWTATSSG